MLLLFFISTAGSAVPAHVYSRDLSSPHPLLRMYYGVREFSTNLSHRFVPRLGSPGPIIRHSFTQMREPRLWQRIERHPTPVGAKRRLTYSILPLPYYSVSAGMGDGSAVRGDGPALAHSHTRARHSRVNDSWAIYHKSALPNEK